MVGAVAVRAQGLWKRSGEQVAVGGIDLEPPAGRFVGPAGPNGAGRTTALSLVTGLLRPDQGAGEIAGHGVWRGPVQVRARIGVLREGLLPFERLSGRGPLACAGRSRGLSGEETDKRAARLLDVLGPGGLRLAAPRTAARLPGIVTAVGKGWAGSPRTPGDAVPRGLRRAGAVPVRDGPRPARSRPAAATAAYRGPSPGVTAGPRRPHAASREARKGSMAASQASGWS
ncbi:ATP-binding cassette domain-containing protein [Streptomyces sp. NPDC093991]|uniref:ATP-binding cassette domain-containing protein n=1 Tax=unclassified Streptomyces TaxID=2593676 RepID=UPI0034157944